MPVHVTTVARPGPTCSGTGEVEIEVEVEYSYRPGTPGWLFGPPSDCWPPEDAEVEIIDASGEGIVGIDALTPMERERIEDEIRAQEAAEGPDPDEDLERERERGLGPMGGQRE